MTVMKFAGLSNYIEVVADFRSASSYGKIAVYAVAYMVLAILFAQRSVIRGAGALGGALKG